ncbi:hypothetical protein COY33_01670 [candidate division WWE3 bacterium CG_4_10_14_0_2_um_filter_42_7]|uniref:Cell division protein FtsX n=2 Tax=Katanobacteria TaxID=422282 RepID=A0A2H0XAA5_UNCKA|nr:MAG: hypothetical protein COT51_01060 [candidate division WWE3 bacterium CG08_land_8_20_14_0_20_41_15]PIZ43336.1 MAG: hypothetical protein COY33_01670 [candidate division WWE3 bacterium CG_4_10_14_0_2_um_filter_42_7]
MKAHLKTTIQQIRRTPYLSLSVVLVIAFTFFLTSIFSAILFSSSKILNYLESKAQITAFFQVDFPEDQILSIKQSLLKSDQISEVAYVSKEDAFKIYTGEHQEEPELLESITAEVFPASLEIRAKDLSYLPEVVSQLKGKEGVEDVIYYKDIIDRFRVVSRAIRFTGLGLVLSMCLISLLVIMLTIGLSIRVRSDELEIMQLVGASDSYIVLPHVFQGAIYGAIASIVSFVAFLLLLPFLTPLVKPLVADVPSLKFGFSFLSILFVAQLLSASFLGAFGSFLSAIKFVRRSNAS